MEKRGRLNVTLGVNLRAIRQARGLSQEQFAHALRYDRTYVASVERGERNLTLDTVSDLADRLGVDALHLLQEPRPEHPV